MYIAANLFCANEVVKLRQGEVPYGRLDLIFFLAFLVLVERAIDRVLKCDRLLSTIDKADRIARDHLLTAGQPLVVGWRGANGHMLRGERVPGGWACSWAEARGDGRCMCTAATSRRSLLSYRENSCTRIRPSHTQTHTVDGTCWEKGTELVPKQRHRSR